MFIYLDAIEFTILEVRNKEIDMYRERERGGNKKCQGITSREIWSRRKGLYTVERIYLLRFSPKCSWGMEDSVNAFVYSTRHFITDRSYRGGVNDAWERGASITEVKPVPS